ncbi:tissue factor pathway inhibitor-like [Ornithorhynchus anatinus]|uniref:tissue factor pathway inhibitor-like n=1 Tax=Ornithorhynchus anatinus TaxID=9258 RepID=UPI0019D4898E|nr:tissue factor pathway inhibitor-like [Ornithorhynchus anatinus]
MYYFNAKANQCKQFIFGGCWGNENRFSTLDECKKACDDSETSSSICQLSYSVGLCKARIPQYHFDSNTQQCKRFYYGGCQGNENRFSIKAECRNTCAAVPLTDDLKI